MSKAFKENEASASALAKTVVKESTAYQHLEQTATAERERLQQLVEQKSEVCCRSLCSLR